LLQTVLEELELAGIQLNQAHQLVPPQVLMAALLLADELSDLRGRLAGLQADHARLQSEAGTVEGRAVAALEAAARRIEKLAGA
jgi:cell division protein ZapA (FtsZ GTPase activity inhibitor)